MIVVNARAGGQRGMGWTYGSAAVAGVVGDVLADVVAGTDPMDVLGAAEKKMNRAVRNVGREGIASMAISAVDIALWDLKAMLLDVPLAALLGQVQSRTCRSTAAAGSSPTTTGRPRDQLTAWVRDAGIPRVKIKIGESWGTNERRDRGQSRCWPGRCIGPGHRAVRRRQRRLPHRPGG